MASRESTEWTWRTWLYAGAGALVGGMVGVILSWITQ